MNNNQRKGVSSNTQVGRDFEGKATTFFSKRKRHLQKNFKIKIGLHKENKKYHRFDLGSETDKILIECKSHTWTEGGNVPSAKMTTWNLAMYYFYLAPKYYQKILFVLRHTHPKWNKTLADYYAETYNHLIPAGVNILEYDEKRKTVREVKFPR